MHFQKLKLVWVIALLSSITAMFAQEQSAIVTYEQTFPRSDPGHYIISITSECRATYQSDGKLTSSAAAEDSFLYEFAISPTNCAKVFELTRRAHYFEKEVDSKKKNLASTGTKILSYKNPQKTTKASYNYSPIAEVRELTAMFQSLGSTLEFGRRLAYDHQYQKLALDEDLKHLEDSAATDQVSAISPTLRKIVDDPSLMNVVRVRAQRVLAAASK